MRGTTGLREVIGRQRELTELEQLLAAARDGRPALAVVEGPAGIGKTALVEQLLSREDDLRVRWVGGMSWEQDIPLGLLRRAVLQDPGLRDLAGDLTDDSPASTGQQLAERWRATSEHPSVVVVDDAHWADLASLRILIYSLILLKRG